MNEEQMKPQQDPMKMRRTRTIRQRESRIVWRLA